MKKTILVVDDEPDIRETVAKALAKDFRVTKAENADDCLKKVKADKPDLILLDIMMPGTPVMKILPKLKSYPIAFLTVVRATEVEQTELKGNKNIVDFIQKPFDLEDLIRRVKQALAK